MKFRKLAIAAVALSTTAAMANISSLTDTSSVRELQQALNDKGFDAGPVDGKAGAQTKAALKKLQQAQGLTASGQLDAQTIAALSVNGSANASTGTTTGATTSTQPDASKEMKDPSAGSMSQQPSTTPQQPGTMPQQPSTTSSK